MTEIVAVDIGGTHARFAIAEVADGRVISLGDACTLKTAEHASLQTAWEDFGREVGRPLPPAASIAVAGRIGGEELKLTNNPWVIRPASIPSMLGAERFTLVNDFGAVAHAVAQLDDRHFSHVCGEDRLISGETVVSIVGPGTGLGVGLLVRRGGHDHVIETEGGHIDFAPLDSLDDQIVAFLRTRYRRVSAERVASGMGLTNIYEALAAIEGRARVFNDERALWTAALAGSDSLASAALDRFCLALGASAGNIALAQGATAVVIAGGIGLRIAEHLPRSGFRSRFIDKGRFERMMDEMPVKLITYPQPGLFGAAAAFAEKFGN